MPDALIDVPHRVQLPGTACALYSLGMVMDYWHAHDSANPTALVCDKDESLQRLEPHVSRFSCVIVIEPGGAGIKHVIEIPRKFEWPECQNFEI